MGEWYVQRFNRYFLRTCEKASSAAQALVVSLHIQMEQMLSALVSKAVYFFCSCSIMISECVPNYVASLA